MATPAYEPAYHTYGEMADYLKAWAEAYRALEPPALPSNALPRSALSESLARHRRLRPAASG